LKVLITGGEGFIGGRLVETLSKRGDQVFSYDKKLGFDIRNYNTLRDRVEEFKPDVIIHLAGIIGTSETFNYPALTAEVNILGTIHVLEAARNIRAKVIYASKPRLWRNPYTITKACAEDFTSMYNEVHGLETVILRLYNVYGPGPGLSKAIPLFITEALRGGHIFVYGYGKQKTDWIYLDDVIQAFLLALESKRAVGECLDIGTGVATSVNDVVKEILELTGNKSKIVYIPMRIGEGPENKVRADVKKPQELMGFQAVTSLKEGLQKTVEYWRNKFESEHQL